jgi:hypothetical protein
MSSNPHTFRTTVRKMKRVAMKASMKAVIEISTASTRPTRLPSFFTACGGCTVTMVTAETTTFQGVVGECFCRAPSCRCHWSSTLLARHTVIGGRSLLYYSCRQSLTLLWFLGRKVGDTAGDRRSAQRAAGMRAGVRANGIVFWAIVSFDRSEFRASILLWAYLHVTRIPSAFPQIRSSTFTLRTMHMPTIGSTLQMHGVRPITAGIYWMRLASAIGIYSGDCPQINGFLHSTTVEQCHMATTVGKCVYLIPVRRDFRTRDGSQSLKYLDVLITTITTSPLNQPIFHNSPVHIINNAHNTVHHSKHRITRELSQDNNMHDPLYVIVNAGTIPSRTSSHRLHQWCVESAQQCLFDLFAGGQRYIAQSMPTFGQVRPADEINISMTVY